MKVKEKIKKLSVKEREVLDQIAVDNNINHPLNICQKLERLELIYQAGMAEIGKDSFGTIIVPVWVMPMAIHIDWCKLCSEECQRKQSCC